MKNFKLLSLALFAVIALTIASCGTDDTPLTPPTPAGPNFSVVEINYTAAGNATEAELVGKVSVTNTSAEDITLHWVRQNVVTPTGWTTAVCDHLQCYTPILEANDLLIEANTTIELKMNFYPDGIAGTGSSDLLIYDTADQANTEATYSFSAVAR
jgi:hypothetical protein